MFAGINNSELAIRREFLQTHRALSLTEVTEVGYWVCFRHHSINCFIKPHSSPAFSCFLFGKMHADNNSENRKDQHHCSWGSDYDYKLGVITHLWVRVLVSSLGLCLKISRDFVQWVCLDLSIYFNIKLNIYYIVWMNQESWT